MQACNQPNQLEGYQQQLHCCVKAYLPVGGTTFFALLTPIEGVTDSEFPLRAALHEGPLKHPRHGIAVVLDRFYCEKINTVQSPCALLEPSLLSQRPWLEVLHRTQKRQK